MGQCFTLGILVPPTIAKPEDVARAAVFFSSDDAGWVTGQSLIVAGGYTH
jgi:NAD(P)-dependent dehydrogenase (short-subunit alcohol dehydrogenase family)